MNDEPDKVEATNTDISTDNMVFTFSEPEQNYRQKATDKVAESKSKDVDDSTDSSADSRTNKGNRRRGRPSKAEKEEQIREQNKPFARQIVGMYAGVGAMVLGVQFLPDKDETEQMAVALENWFVEMGVEGNLPAWAQVVVVFGMHAGTRLAIPEVRQKAIGAFYKVKGLVTGDEQSGNAERSNSRAD